MTSAEIIAAIRKGIREPTPVTVSDTDITAVILRGVLLVGLEIKEVAPSFFNKRVSVTSDTHVFAWPSDCETILNVWDLKTTVATITGATNASPIVITSAAHGFSDDDIVVVHDVVGNTAANGTWKVDTSATNTFELYGSTGNAAYSSGGYAFQLKSTIRKVRKINLENSTLQDKTSWFPQGDYVVIDHPDFEYDIMVDYIAYPDAIADIPVEYHDYLVSFGIVDLMIMPAADDPRYPDRAAIMRIHSNRLLKMEHEIRRTLKASTEPKHLGNEFDFDSYLIS